MKSQLEAHLNMYKHAQDRLNLKNFTMIEDDFQNVDWTKQPKFDVVHFDVAPVSAEVYDDFFNYIVPALAPESVVVFSQQSNSDYAELLSKAILKHSDKVIERFRDYRISNSMSDSYKYFSGIAMIGFKKKVGVAPKAATANVTINTGATKK